MKKIYSLPVLLLAGTMLCSCNNVAKQEGQTQEMHSVEEEDSPITQLFEPYSDTVVAKQQSKDGVTILLNHVAFETGKVILDYTVEAKNATNDYLCNISASSPDGVQTGMGGGCLSNVENNFPENSSSTSYAVLEWDEDTLTSSDVGKKAKIQFEVIDISGKTDETRVMEFEVNIEKLYEVKVVDMHQNFSDTSEQLETIEVSPFYLKAHYAVEDDSFIYALRMEDDKGEYLDMFGPNHEDEQTASAYFMWGDKSTESLELWQIEYDDDGNANKIGEPIKVELSSNKKD